ncbi:MAG: hypothetical protein EOQ64_05070 [Mesorhizobium sp.]|nr:MAG: hypothetical protein EOQ64_05070 [Mesorhizobium sp.]RWH45718.1 MAG: hypothetical protein EOQ78_06015 [Mesorhizobium sp.]
MSKLGRHHLAQQRERIAQLDRDGLPTEDALEFFALLESMQELHERHLSRLLAKAADRALNAPVRAAGSGT